MADQVGPLAASPRSQQLASFIFDPVLPRSRYTQLIQLDGVVHCIVKRLLEKHQGDSHLLIEANVAGPIPCRIGKRKRGREQRTGFLNATNFMMRLSTLKPLFNEDERCQASDPVVWPGFGKEVGRDGGSWKRKRQAEVGLVEGVISGLEVCLPFRALADKQAIQTTSRPSQVGSPPSLLNSLCPAEARPLLTALYTPPPSPPLHPPSSNTISKYLFIFAYDGGPSDRTDEDWNPIMQTCCRDAEWDAMGWDEISSRCTQSGVKVSLVVSEAGEGDGQGKKRLKGFIDKVSPDTSTAAWFTLPPRTSTHLTSLSLPSTTSAQPARSSPINTAPPELPAQPVLNPHQALAMRFLAQRNQGGAQLPGGLSNPAVSAALANFMAAARNGNIDPNDPQMAQFKQMIMMQQQMAKEGDQAQRMKAMAALQAQQGAGAGAARAGSVSGKSKVWAGEIVWPVNTGEARLSVECTTANNGNVADASQIASLLPRVSSMQADSAFLQAFVREHKTPVLQFELSSDSPAEPVLTKRFESLINGLNAKGTNVPLPNSPNRQPPAPSAQSSYRPPQEIQEPTIPLPAPYRPPPQSYPSTSNPAPPNAGPGPGMPGIQASSEQLRALIKQATLMGIQTPPDLDPATLNQAQLKMLLHGIKQKSMQQKQQQLMMMQAQQQAQAGGGGMGGGGQGGGMSGVDPRLMPGGGVDPRLMVGGEGGGNQLGLQQMQMQMQSSIGQGGDGQGYMGSQYQGK